MQIREYRDFYGAQLAPEDKKLLDLFCNEHYNFINAMKKVCYKHRYRGRMTDEIMVRVIMLIGQL